MFNLDIINACRSNYDEERMGMIGKPKGCLPQWQMSIYVIEAARKFHHVAGS